jgi:hypothetical protein
MKQVRERLPLVYASCVRGHTAAAVYSANRARPALRAVLTVNNEIVMAALVSRFNIAKAPGFVKYVITVSKAFRNH